MSNLVNDIIPYIVVCHCKLSTRVLNIDEFVVIDE